MPENVMAPGVTPTGFDTGSIGNAVKSGVNAVTETFMRMTLSAGALSVALVLLILGTVILMRGNLSKAATVVGGTNPVGKGLSKAAKVVK
jgi:hypothetical protein